MFGFGRNESAGDHIISLRGEGGIKIQSAAILEKPVL
jgi:hypothetical protein